MNKQLEEFVRYCLKLGLENCTAEQHLLFKRMYSHTNLDLPINEVVDKMPTKQLDWAMQQVEYTLHKNSQ